MLAAALGWIGTIGTIGAYLMLTRGHWHAASLRYSAMNVIGGLLCAAGSAAYGAWPSVTANLVWAGAALHSAWPVLRARRESSIRLRDEAGPNRTLISA